MKKFLILSFCCTSFAAFSQQQFYLKKFPANNSTRYITNSPTVRGIVFFYEVAKDTNNIVMYVPGFKKEDIQFVKDKAVISNSEICFPDYKSSPGDLVYAFNSAGDFIYFYHPRPGELEPDRYNR